MKTTSKPELTTTCPRASLLWHDTGRVQLMYSIARTSSVTKPIGHGRNQSTSQSDGEFW